MSNSTTLDDLDSVAEWNLSQRLKEQLARLKAEGLQVKLAGETAKTEAVALDVHFTGGSLFPFRNLNLPATEYLHTSRMMNHAEVDFFFIKQSAKVRKVKELLEIDLKDLNKREKKERDMEIRQIQSGLKLIPLIIKTVDVGIVSKHKLWISNSSGELLDGDSTSEKEEFHTLRLEKVLEPHLGLLRWLPPWSTYQQWLERQLMEFTQWTIADVDGWMGGNPLTK